METYLHLKKVEAFLYGNCGGTFSVRAYLHSKKVEAFLYGNCNVALKFHYYFNTSKLFQWRHILVETYLH